MKLRNPTGDLRHTWSGEDIQPGQTVEVEITDAEIDWHRRHGMEVGAPETIQYDPKPAPTTPRVDGRTRAGRRERGR